MLSFRDLFSLYNSVGLYMGLYFAALVYIVAKGDRREKIVFLTTPLLLFVLVLNPFSLTLANRVFGETDTLYRLFWIFPVGILLAYCVAKFVGEQTEKKKSVVMALCCFAVIGLSGRFVLQAVPYTVAETPMKIAPQLIEIVDILQEDRESDAELANEEVCVAVSSDFILDMRLYDPSLILAYSQDEVVGRLSGTNHENMEVLVDLFSRNIPHEYTVVERVFQEEEVNYIVCPQSLAVVSVLDAMETELLDVVDGFAVYKYNGGAI